MLLAWTSAQALCVGHCHGFGDDGAGVGNGRSAHACCSKTSSDASDSGKPLSAAGECGMRAVAKVESASDELVVAFLPVAVMALKFAPAPDPATTPAASAVHLARLPRIDTAFVPEVSLGAALRGLAPPALA